jgi:hypothetical protein
MKGQIFFPLSHANRDIFYAELQSTADPAALALKLELVAQALERLVSPEHVIFHLEDTPLDRFARQAVSDLIVRHQEKYCRFALVGVHGLRGWRLRWLICRRLDRMLPWRVENDFQKAKDWIVSAFA